MTAGHMAFCVRLELQLLRIREQLRQPQCVTKAAIQKRLNKMQGKAADHVEPRPKRHRADSGYCAQPPQGRFDLCRRCQARPPEPDRSRCAECWEKDNTRNREYRRRDPRRIDARPRQTGVGHGASA